MSNEVEFRSEVATTNVEAAQQEYEDAKYPRSDLSYLHLPLDPFLKTHPGFKDDALVPLLTILPAGVIIAGGYPASLLSARKNAADIDLWFPDGDVFEKTVERLLSHGFTPIEPDREVVGAYRLKYGEALDQRPVVQFRSWPAGLPVQCIKIAWYQNAEHVIDCFDFTVTQVAIDVAKKELVVNPLTFEHLGRQVLVQHRVEGDEAIGRRLTKYLAKGFRPTGEDLIKLAAQVAPEAA